MKSSIHFVLKGKSDYKDLAPVFQDVLTAALTVADQVPEEEEMTMIVQLNLGDLELNRKPEGYLRRARIRMVFPIGRKEFYFQSYNSKLVNLNKVRDRVSAILDDAGIKYSTAEDDDIRFDVPRRD
ncbi:hypothetical protein PAA26_04760 [Methanomassiliicoccaceae archaeon COG_1]|nr:hypothetical protein [Methanomassiliicoccaceae archaeon COG_1]